MAEIIPYENRKQDILRVLRKAARNGKKITYGELGQTLGIPGRGPWKGVLDEISREEVEANRPDVTFMVVLARTGYPGQIGGAPANPPSDAQKTVADKIIKEVLAFYRR